MEETPLLRHFARDVENRYLAAQIVDSNASERFAHRQRLFAPVDREERRASLGVVRKGRAELLFPLGDLFQRLRSSFLDDFIVVTRHPEIREQEAVNRFGIAFRTGFAASRRRVEPSRGAFASLRNKFRVVNVAPRSDERVPANELPAEPRNETTGENGV